jgi:Rhamnan synthesis protein F
MMKLMPSNDTFVSGTSASAQALNEVAEFLHLVARQEAAVSADRTQREELLQLIALLPGRTKVPEPRIRFWTRPRYSREYKTLAGSALFDAGWYLSHNIDVLRAGADPVQHYLQQGYREGRKPGPHFDGASYLQANPDVAQSGQNPLLHFLDHGASEGRRVPADIPPLELAELYCLKFSTIGSEVALLVTHSPNGRIKPHVEHFIESLARNDIGVVLVVATDEPLRPVRPTIASLLSGLFVRENKGYDFAAWAHVMRIAPQLFKVERLYLLNDSFFGPLNLAKFAALLSRIRESSADLTGLTDSNEYNWHIQSYFLSFRMNMRTTYFIKRFFGSVKSQPDLDSVTRTYEVPLAQQMRDVGLECETIFRSNDYFDGNELPRNISLCDWKELIRNGFPFVKVKALREGYGRDGWREILSDEGYDVALADRLLVGV